MTLVNKTFSQLITFTRASSATFVGSNGLIQSATTNTPRFDYDPVTLAAKGLLIEEQRTNLCLYSSGVGGTGWNNTNAGTGVLPVSTTNFAVAPDGTTTASRVQVSLGGGTTSTDQSITAQTLTGTSCRGSFYIKTNDGSSKTIYVRGQNAASITVDGTWRRYDFDAGTLSGTQFGVGLRGGQTPTNSDTADLLVWGAQLEAGSFATSYIPTVASQVTRSADVASVNTLSPWYNATEGTLYVEADAFINVTATQVYNSASINDGTTSNRHRMFIYNGSWGAAEVVGGVIQCDLKSFGSYTANVKAQSAFGYKVNDFALSVNGATALTDTSGSIITSVSRLSIGGSPADNYINGHIRRITYYKRRLSNADLQSITL